MKTQFLKLIIVLLTLNFLSCNQKGTLSEYRYTDKPDFACAEIIDNKLIKEALYTFEDDIINLNKSQNLALDRAYQRFTPNALRSRIKLEDVASKRSLEILEVLKTYTDLFIKDGARTTINQSHPLFSCIGRNITTQDIKTSYNALLQTNSFKTNLIGAPLTTSSRTLATDKYLALYVALDLYYAKLMDIDFSKMPPKEEINPNNVNNQQPKTEVNDPHAGHNH